jgi:hypothetical protein
MKILYLYRTQKKIEKIMQNIKQIVALDAFSVRLPTLWMEESLENCRLDSHILATAVHFG